MTIWWPMIQKWLWKKKFLLSSLTFPITLWRGALAVLRRELERGVECHLRGFWPPFNTKGMFPEKMKESWQWPRVLRRQTALWSRPFDFSIGVFHQPPQIEFIYEQMTWTGSLSFDISLADRYGKWPLRVLHPVRWWSCLNNLFYEGVRVFSSIVSRTFRKDRHGGIGGEGILAEIKSCPEWLQNQSWNPFLRHASR